MFSPTLSPQDLGMQRTTRRDQAIERGIDAMHDLLEWSPPTRQPAAAGFMATRSRIDASSPTRRVVFTGRFWMSDEPVAAWRPMSTKELEALPHRPVSHLDKLCQSALVASGQSAPAVQRARTFDQLSLEPLELSLADPEQSALSTVTRLELKVEVVSFARPADKANGLSTGRVLAVTENFCAQETGVNRVVIHENKNLDRPLRPGDKVTMDYQDGKATVYDGLMHDINIEADWMPKDQQAFLRMSMLDALSALKVPQGDDKLLQEAMRYALECTAKFFGASETRLRRADIQLSVNSKKAVVKPDGALQPVPLSRGPRP